MDKERFNKIFDETLKLAGKNFWTQEKVQERIDRASDENGKLDLYQFGAYLADQSREYTNQFIYTLLFDLLVDDTDPDSNSGSK